MSDSQPFKPEALNGNGLNLQYVFNIAELPNDIVASLTNECDHLHQYPQLILIGNGGLDLWHSLPHKATGSDNQIDDFTCESVVQWLSTEHPTLSYHIIYPPAHNTKQSVDLVSLGKLAGWHHETPFKVGINQHWGPWFAYRAAIVANSQFNTSEPMTTPSPCSTCEQKNCISHCPAGACDGGALNVETCISYRKQANSRCHHTCLARTSCPVQTQHRYTEAQINYHYTESIKIIKQYDL